MDKENKNEKYKPDTLSIVLSYYSLSLDVHDMHRSEAPSVSGILPSPFWANP
jgi:hypothetical protein